MSLQVTVNNPALPAGTELTVAGIAVMFVNGQTVEVPDNAVDSNLVTDAEALLSAVSGFTVVAAPVAVAAPSPQVSNATTAANIQEGGETQ